MTEMKQTDKEPYKVLTSMLVSRRQRVCHDTMTRRKWGSEKCVHVITQQKQRRLSELHTCDQKMKT